MKRLLCILLVAIGLVGCGTESSNTTAASDTAKPTIGSNAAEPTEIDMGGGVTRYTDRAAGVVCYKYSNGLVSSIRFQCVPLGETKLDK